MTFAFFVVNVVFICKWPRPSYDAGKSAWTGDRTGNGTRMSTEADTCRKYVVPKLQAGGWENVAEILGKFGGADWFHNPVMNEQQPI